MKSHLWSYALPALIVVVTVLTVSSAEAKVDKSKEIMQPVDTSAGSFSDPKALLQVDLSRYVSVGISAQPMELAYNQISGLLGIEWGFAAGVDSSKLITLNTSGPAREVMKALGNAAGVRFEAGGPTQIRVVPARTAPPKKHANPPPAQHP